MPHIFGQGEAHDQRALPLHTRRGDFIRNERPLPKRPEQMEAAREMHMDAHPKWELRALRAEYNCMGLVFAYRRTAIDPDQFDLIVEGDGLRRLDLESQAMVGDVAVFRHPGEGTVEHVALVTGLRNDLVTAQTHLSVLSQFGSDGEYLHDALDLPAGILPAMGPLRLEVWTDREA